MTTRCTPDRPRAVATEADTRPGEVGTAAGGAAGEVTETMAATHPERARGNIWHRRRSGRARRRTASTSATSLSRSDGTISRTFAARVRLIPLASSVRKRANERTNGKGLRNIDSASCRVCHGSRQRGLCGDHPASQRNVQGMRVSRPAASFCPPLLQISDAGDPLHSIVEYSTHEEASRAIKELNEGMLMGRPAFLREVGSRPDSSKLHAQAGPAAEQTSPLTHVPLLYLFFCRIVRTMLASVPLPCLADRPSQARPSRPRTLHPAARPTLVYRQSLLLPVLVAYT